MSIQRQVRFPISCVALQLLQITNNLHLCLPGLLAHSLPGTSPAAKSATGSVDFKGLGVLRYVSGQSCDIVYTSPDMQSPSSAALLLEIEESLEDGDAVSAGKQDKSRAFLELLLGQEGAQAALAAVQRCSPFTYR